MKTGTRYVIDYAAHGQKRELLASGFRVSYTTRQNNRIQLIMTKPKGA